MSNVEIRTVTVIRHEVMVPVRDGKVTRRDLFDLLVIADRKYRDLHPNDPHISRDQDLYDDAYHVEPRDDVLVAVIPIET